MPCYRSWWDFDPLYKRRRYNIRSGSRDRNRKYEDGV